MALRLAGEGYAEGGVTEFLGLSDTPGSYSGQGGKYAKVKSAEDALEFDTPSGGGDMLKSVYDTDDDGIVDNSEKLEGSTKAEVQDHDPKAHTHTESEITDLEHDAVKLQGRDLDSGAPADGQVVTWEQASNKWKPKTPAGGGDMLKSVYDTDDDGIVDNAEKLEGSTKAEVQDHDPKAHAASHQDGGADEISVAGLSGELAGLQKPKDHTHQSSGGGVGGKLDHGLALDGLGDDDHSQYLNNARHDTTDRHSLGTVVPHDALASLTEKAHSSLTGVGADDHHSRSHDHSLAADGSPIAVDGVPNLPASKINSGTFDVARIPDGVRTAVITFVIDGGGSAITTGEKGHVEVPFACTIQQVTLLADQSGSIKIDIWKDTYANFPPTDADSICGGNEPEISSGVKDQDSTLTGWTTGINAGDILAFNVDSCSTIERVTIALKVLKS